MCCFSNDCKVAVVDYNDSKIVDLDTDDQKSVKFDYSNLHFNGEKIFCLNKDRVVIGASPDFLEFFDMDSGAHLTRDSQKQLKLSPKETMMAFPKINGDMEFLRLCIPQDPMLSSIKREAANKLKEKTEMVFH